MSKITIVDLEVFLNVGVSDEERAQPQRVLLTVDMEYDFSSAAASDRITKTIDYYAVAQELLKLGEGRSWRLIEKIAADVAGLVLNKFRPERVTVLVKKFPIPQAHHVSVSLTLAGSGGGSVKRAGWGIP
jgi:7,8-dihydroneopterin aldolase/epimerase/oxygenase